MRVDIARAERAFVSLVCFVVPSLLSRESSMADFGASDLQTIRQDVRDWLKVNLPPSLAGNDEAFADNESARTAVREDIDLWRRRVAEKGWGAPTWPQHLGGGGLSAAEAG